MTRCLRETQVLAPDLFKDVKINVANRWKMDVRTILGRPKSLTDGPTSRIFGANILGEVRYMQDVHEIPDSRVYNIDETSIRILPQGEYGWAMKNTEAQSRWFAQILVSGKSTLCLPHGTFDS
eukprot:5339624-Amphidinium_carterae.1